MPTLPTGTVTLLFTDIEGSTRLLDEYGQVYADILGDHRRRLREAFARHGGTEVDTQGDSFFVVFTSAAAAVAAAADVQADLGDGPVRVRIGVHTGEPMVGAEGYVGADVHVGARIMAAAHGGQVLLSDATQRLLGDGVSLTDLGEHRLKDLGPARRLFQLGDAKFPPLRTLYRTNLPVQPSPLVGRGIELSDVGALLRDHRLVTLLGPGGSGKTRLALQVAAESTEHFPDGVFWVPLQALREPAHVERAIATAIGADESVTDYIGGQRILLLADNFEQVIEAASTIADVLTATPNTKVIVTSREPLRIESEQRYPLPPLPDDDAVVLFGLRARAVAPNFQASPAVGQICRRLDGLPLAIELAAARMALLDADDLLARLEKALPLLATRSRDAPERQRTLRATIEWSHDLLDADEQALFRRLAVFRGSFTVEAAERAGGADLDVLESLVAKSLVRRWANGRLGMLDTIREYALERFEESPESEELRRAHAEYFLTVALEAHLNASERRGVHGQRLDLALLEIDNFRSALAWTLRSGSIDLGMQIAIALEQLWVTVDPAEGISWFERLLEAPGADQASPDDRAQALRAYGSSLHILGRPDLAEQVSLRSLAIFEEQGDEHGQAVMLHRLAITAMIRGDLAQARALVQRSDEIHRRQNDIWGLGQTTGTLASIARDEGDDSSASELFRESAQLARESGVPWWESGALAELACISIDAGRLDDAEREARAALEISDGLRDRPSRIFSAAILCRIAAERGDTERAGKLWAVVENAEYGAPMGGWMRHRRAFAARIEELADTNFERGYAAGLTLTLDEAVAIAMG